MTASLAANLDPRSPAPAEFCINEVGQESDKAADQQQTVPSPWILNPVLDYLFACGGLAWIFFGLHYFVLAGTREGPAAASLLAISSIGALLIGEGHTAATFVHTYRNVELSAKFAFYTKLLPLLFIALAAAGTFVPAVAAVMVKLYLLIVPHHFMAQAYGIARLYCAKRNYAIEDDERRSLILLTWCTTVFATLRQLSPNEIAKPFLAQSVLQWHIIPQPLFELSRVFLFASAILFLALIASKAIKERKFFPMPAIASLCTSIAAFVVTDIAHTIYWLYVSAFFHATQYFLTVLAAHWKEQNVESCSDRLRSLVTLSPTTRMLGLTLLVSVFLYIGVPRILESFGCNYLLAMASIFTAINMHHAAVDGVIWKLRRKEVRNALV